MIASILSLILTFLVEGFIQDAVIVNARGRSFLIDTAGQIVTKQDYSQIEDCADGLYRAVDKKTGKWGGIDMAEKQIIPFVYNEVYLCRHHCIPARQGTEWGIISPENEIIIPVEYESVDVLSNGYCVAEKDGDVFVFNGKGRLLNRISQFR